MEFSLTLSESGAKLEAGTERALKIEDDLRQAFDDLDLSPSFIGMPGVRTGIAGSTEATIHARVLHFWP